MIGKYITFQISVIIFSYHIMSTVRIPVKNIGDFTSLGYSTSLPEDYRHLLIESKLIPQYGYTYVIRKLNAVATLNKKNSAGHVLRADQQFTSRLYKDKKLSGGSVKR